MRPSTSAYPNKRRPSFPAAVHGRRLISSRQDSALPRSIRAHSALGHRDPKEIERAEISSQLAALKKSYNLCKREEIRTDKKLSAYSFEHKVLEQGRASSETHIGFLNSQILSLQQRIQKTLELQKAAGFDRQVNLHVLERMRQTKIHLDIQKHKKQEQLRHFHFLLNEKEKMLFRTKENQKRQVLAYRSMKAEIDEDRREKNFQLSCLEKDISEQRKLEMRREERMRRQLVIAEAAANEDRDRRETVLREKLMVHRLWHFYLNAKLEKSMKDSVIIEKAFNQIRLATGTNEVESIVEKFLTRERSYTNLRGMVTQANTKCIDYKTKIAEIEDKVYQFNIADRGSGQDLDGLNKTFLNNLKELDSAKHRLKRVNNTVLRLKNWVKRMHTLFYPHDPLPEENVRAMFLHSLSKIGELVKGVDAQSLAMSTQRKHMERYEDVVKSIGSESVKKLSWFPAEIEDEEIILAEMHGGDGTMENVYYREFLAKEEIAKTLAQSKKGKAAI